MVLSVLTGLVSGNVNSGGGMCYNNPMKAKKRIYIILSSYVTENTVYFE